MIVPISSAKGAPAMAPIPSQTNLLMALATMHQLGKFGTKDDDKVKPVKLPQMGGES